MNQYQIRERIARLKQLLEALEDLPMDEQNESAIEDIISKTVDIIEKLRELL